MYSVNTDMRFIKYIKNLSKMNYMLKTVLRKYMYMYDWLKIIVIKIDRETELAWAVDNQS